MFVHDVNRLWGGERQEDAYDIYGISESRREINQLESRINKKQKTVAQHLLDLAKFLNNSRLRTNTLGID